MAMVIVGTATLWLSWACAVQFVFVCLVEFLAPTELMGSMGFHGYGWWMVLSGWFLPIGGLAAIVFLATTARTSRAIANGCFALAANAAGLVALVQLVPD